MRNTIGIYLLATLLCACSPDYELSGGHTAIVEYPYIEENQWIYQTMNRNYLWRDDLPDSLSCNYNLYPSKFFESLLSDKDRFSYYQSNSNSTRASHTNDYGFAYQRYTDNSGNIFYQVLYITSPTLKSLGLQRGDFLISCKNNEGESKFQRVIFRDGKHILDSLVIDCNGSSRSSKSNSTVLLDTIYSINDKKIGYMCYLQFDSVQDFSSAIKRFKEHNIDELILDLRYNPGGFVSTCIYLCTEIGCENVYEQVCQTHRYNDIIAKENYDETGDSLSYEYFRKPTPIDAKILGTPLYGLNMKRLYTITSKNTASASEATISCLRPYMPVYIIGETTTGKGTGMRTFSNTKCRIDISPLTFRYYNADHETVPDSGLTPDLYCPDGYNTRKKDIGDIKELLLAATLQYMGLDVENGENNTQDKVSQLSTPSLIPIGDPSFVEEYKLKHSN